MNEAHFHLTVNHFPIIGLTIGILVLITGLTIKNATVKRTAFGILIFAALTAIPSMLSGEGAEEIVEEYANVNHDTIHEHEEQAEIFIKIIIGLGLISIVSLWADIKQKAYAKQLYYVILILSLITFYFGKTVGSSGGEIRHPEISVEKAAVPALPAKEETDDDHDDHH
ncbi:MAG: hypothetical protein RLZZ337_397 [Bacteroidota bacterium]|jgi:uncharacterized membrane protein